MFGMVLIVKRAVARLSAILGWLAPIDKPQDHLIAPAFLPAAGVFEAGPCETIRALKPEVEEKFFRRRTPVILPFFPSFV
jgi:hypothetical protein